VRMTKISVLGTLALAIVMTGCVDRSAQQQAKRTEKIAGDRSRAVEIIAPTLKTLEETLDINGQITTSDDTNIGAKQSGKLVAVSVQDGDSVTSGQVLAVQDTSVLQAQLQQSLAQVASAQASLSQAMSNAALGPAKSSAALNTALAQLRSAKSQLQKQLNGARPEERRQALANLESARKNLEVQQKNLDRIQTLVTQGAVAANQLDSQQNAVASAKANFQSAQETVNLQNAGNRAEDIAAARESVRQAEESVKNARAAKDLDVLYKDQVNAAKAQVDSAMAQVRIVQQNISDMTIKAPFSGRVSGKPAQVGTVVAPGSTIVRLIGNQAPYFEGSVPEYELGRVSIGSTVAVKIDSMGDRTFNGRVAAYNPLGTAVGRQFSARIELQGDISAIRPGMFATGTVVIKRMPNSTLVPSRAVVNSDGESVVFTADGTKAKRVPVKTGVTQGDLIQVTGLPAGAQVIVKGQEALNDGSLIKVEAAAAPAAGPVGG
jgi:HlyD family secretion protein